MITTIYNIFILIISSYIIHEYTIQTITIWYAVLCLVAIFITMTINQTVSSYPKVSAKQKESVELIFGEMFSFRLINFVATYCIHAFLLYSVIQSYSLIIAISGVLFIRVFLLIKGNKKVKEELNE